MDPAENSRRLLLLEQRLTAPLSDVGAEQAEAVRALPSLSFPPRPLRLLCHPSAETRPAAVGGPGGATTVGVQEATSGGLYLRVRGQEPRGASTTASTARLPFASQTDAKHVISGRRPWRIQRAGSYPGHAESAVAPAVKEPGAAGARLEGVSRSLSELPIPGASRARRCVAGCATCAGCLLPCLD
jgi:hypothetical protein